MSLGARGVHVCYEMSFLARAHTLYIPHATLSMRRLVGSGHDNHGNGFLLFRGVQCTIRDMGVYRIRMTGVIDRSIREHMSTTSAIFSTNVFCAGSVMRDMSYFSSVGSRAVSPALQQYGILSPVPSGAWPGH